MMPVEMKDDENKMIPAILSLNKKAKIPNIKVYTTPKKQNR
jgi:hypothetical protein